MSIKLGVVMDPIADIAAYKDTTLAMLLAAQARGWTLQYMELADIYTQGGQAWGRCRGLSVYDDTRDWYELGEATERPLAELDVILMRKDPPFDMEYVYATYILQRAEAAGVLVVNKPAALRDINEKMSINTFAEYTPPTLVTREAERIRGFLQQQQRIVVKPLDGMGGANVFVIAQGDLNTNVILENLTHHGNRYTMAQKYLPQIAEGDKRILIIDGQAVPYALARIPAAGESRGNLAAGASGNGVELNERDREIGAALGPTLRDMGILFAGLDVIGDYLTEINVTSPTCVRELNQLYDLDLGGQIMDAIAKRLPK